MITETDETGSGYAPYSTFNHAQMTSLTLVKHLYLAHGTTNQLHTERASGNTDKKGTPAEVGVEPHGSTFPQGVPLGAALLGL